MVGQVVTDVQALDFAILAELLKQVLVKVFKVVLDLARVEGLALRVNTRSDHVRALVHVGEQQCWADARLRVQPRASISMSTSSDLKVERTVHSILLCSENRRQVFSH